MDKLTDSGKSPSRDLIKTFEKDKYMLDNTPHPMRKRKMYVFDTDGNSLSHETIDGFENITHEEVHASGYTTLQLLGDVFDSFWKCLSIKKYEVDVEQCSTDMP